MLTRHEKKHAAILNAATAVFMKNGFANSSMDAIAEAAPVSKATLYKHFVDKKDLFQAAVRFRCESLVDKINISVQTGGTVEEALRQIAQAFIDMVYSYDALNVLRILCSESAQFPDLAKMYFEDGPKLALSTLSSYLHQLHEQNLMNIPDSNSAANLFISMMKGELFTQCLLGIKTSLSNEESQSLIQESVCVFIKGYACEQKK